MRSERLFSGLCAAGISLCLGLGAVGSMATGLSLPVELPALVICCILLAIFLTVCGSFRYGTLVLLVFGAALCFRDAFWQELKTVGAILMGQLHKGYGLPIPAFLEGELSESVLLVLGMLAGAMILVTARAVLKGGNCLIPAAVSLIPLISCITVVYTVPDSPWLYLWGLGLVLLIMTQTTRRKDVKQGNRLTGILAIPVAGVLLLLFWLIPRDAPACWNIPNIPGKLLSSLTGEQGSGTAPTPVPPVPVLLEKVDLSDLRERDPKGTVVMTVEADFSGYLYLRGKDYDSYSGTKWSSRENREETLHTNLLQPRGTVTIKTVEPQDVYYLPGYPDTDQTLVQGVCENPDKETEYTFSCGKLNQMELNQLPLHPEDSEAVKFSRRYLEIPSNTRPFLETYLSGIDWSYRQGIQERVNLVDMMVTGAARYDLNTPKMPEDQKDLVSWFLTESETGYCVHFATSAAMLLRSMGVSSRYVEGYMVSVKAGKTVEVTDAHAHAWVEYYLDSVGWVILETTPPSGLPQQVPETTFPDLTEPSETTAPTAPTEPKDDPPVVDTAPEIKIHPAIIIIGQCLIGLMGLCLLIWAQYRLRRRLLKRRLKQGSVNRQALAIYRQLKKTAAFYQPIPQACTQLAQKARFSPHKLSKDDLRILLKQLEENEITLKERPFRERLVAKWILALY